MMHVLSTAELLNVWEQGNLQTPLQRALLLLAAACPEKSFQELAQLSLGQRDGLLLSLREKTFGEQLNSVVVCPKCTEKVELNFKTTDLVISSAQEVPEVQSLTVDEYTVQFHLPNSQDMAAIAGDHSLGVVDTLNPTLSPTLQLLEQCLEHISYQGQEVALEQLPPSVINAIQTQMAETDPQADIQINLECPVCGNSWQTLFDIVSFFWSEINTWAKRTLYEVHLLASAYGWGESDIIALSPQRRNLYLEMIRL